MRPYASFRLTATSFPLITVKEVVISYDVVIQCQAHTPQDLPHAEPDS